LASPLLINDDGDACDKLDEVDEVDEAPGDAGDPVVARFFIFGA